VMVGVLMLLVLFSAAVIAAHVALR